MVEAYKELIENFKPNVRREDLDVILEHVFKNNYNAKSFFANWKSATYEKFPIRQADGSYKILLRYTLRTWHDERTEGEITLSPKDLGFFKESEILVSTLESGVLDLEERKVVDGRFLFKTTVKIPDVAEWKSKYVFWLMGKIWLVDLSRSDMFTDELIPKQLMEEGFEEFSDIKEAYKKRVRLPNEIYRELKADWSDPINKKKPIKLHYCISELGDVSLN
jgi:hypothetical protein